MARRTTKTATATENEEVNQPEVDQTEGTDQSDEGEVADTTTEPTADTTDPFYAEFLVDSKVAANTIEGHTEVTFNVTRWRKREYSATLTLGDQLWKGSVKTKAKTAIESCIAAASKNVKAFTFNAEDVEPPMPETAGGNQPETEVAFYDDPDDEQGKLLVALEPALRDADKALVESGEKAKQGWLGFGRAYNEARAIFAAKNIDVENTDQANAKGRMLWGKWFRTHLTGLVNVEKVLSNVNSAAQAGLFASAPAEVLAKFPTVNTASTFRRKYDEAISGIKSGAEDKRPGFADRAGERLYAVRSELPKQDILNVTVADVFAIANEVHQADLARDAKNRAAYEKAKTDYEANEGKGKKPVRAEKHLEADNAIIAWLLPDQIDEFENSLLHKRIVGAFEAEVKAPSPQEKAEAEEVEKKKAKEAKKEADTRAFADFGDDEAAAHLLKMLVSHPNRDNVLDILAGMLDGWNERKAEHDAAAKEAADEEGTTA